MLAVNSVSKRFGGLQAVDDVTLTAAAGEVVGVIGPNGAGKSTLFNLIAGFHRPDSGSIRLHDTDLTHQPAAFRARRGISRTFQLVHLVDDMTVADNVRLGCYAAQADGPAAGLLRLTSWRRTERDARQRAEQALKLVGLTGRADVVAGALAYGERRLAEVARCIAGAPQVVLLDEPAAGLNATEAARLANVVTGLRSPERTVLLVEHNVPFVMGVCDHVTVLDQGAVIASGTPDVVQADDRVVVAYLGTPA